MGNSVRNLEPERLALEPAGIVLNRRKKRLNRRTQLQWEKRQVVWTNDGSFSGTAGRFSGRLVVWIVFLSEARGSAWTGAWGASGGAWRRVRRFLVWKNFPDCLKSFKDDYRIMLEVRNSLDGAWIVWRRGLSMDDVFWILKDRRA